jgi:hypothetical protein
VGVAALILGFSGILGSGDLGARFVGAGALVAGVIISAAAICVALVTQRWTAWFGVLAGLFGATFGVVMWLAQDRGGAPTALRFVPILLALGSVPVVIYGAGNLRLRDLRDFRVIAGIFASVVSIGALTGLADFVYHAVYLPGQVTPTLTVTPMLSSRGTKHGMDVIDVGVTLQNPTSTKVRVLGSTYQVVGYRVAPAKAGASALAERSRQAFVRNSASAAGPSASRFSRTTGGTVVQAGTMFAPGIDFEFEPQERFATNTTVYVPHNRFDLLRVTAEMIVAKSDRLSLSPKRTFPFHRAPVRDSYGSMSVFAERTIRETSLFRKLTRGKRVLIYVWTVKPSKQDPFGRLGPHLSIYVDREINRPDQALEDRLAEYYGITGAYATTELPLPARKPR